MANAQLFNSLLASVPCADTVNHHNAPAYAYKPKHKLAQLAMTGCLSQTYYADANTQLNEILALSEQLPDAYIAQTAIYCRQYGYMKDMPALLVAALAARQSALLPAAFTQVVDNGKMLRNFVQIIRSGAIGRRSFGTRPKKLIQRWLLQASEYQLLQAAVGTTPSLADIVKMVHPKPEQRWQRAFFAWLIGKPFDPADLPELTRSLLAYRAGQTEILPAVPFQLLTSETLTAQDWAALSKTMGWHALRMNLNTLARQGALALPGVAKKVAARLADREAIARAKVYPYQLLTAYRMMDQTMPEVIREGLQDALDHALVNIPVLEGRVVVCPDVSGSMSSPLTGYRKGATTRVRCIDVAALIAAAMLRTQKNARILPFAVDVVDITLNKRDAVMTNANKLAAIGGGGTNCAAPLAHLASQKVRVDTVIMVSDNESWAATSQHGSTPTMQAWTQLKRFNPDARLVCIDLQPYGRTQAQERQDILNVGGFGDAAFNVIAQFAAGSFGAGHWVEAIESLRV